MLKLSVVYIFSLRRTSFLKCESVKRINYSNMSVSQAPPRTFVQIQKQMSMPMDRLRKNLQLAWPFNWKVLRYLWRGKNFPKDLIKVKRYTRVLFEIWLPIIIYDQNSKSFVGKILSDSYLKTDNCLMNDLNEPSISLLQSPPLNYTK